MRTLIVLSILLAACGGSAPAATEPTEPAAALACVGGAPPAGSPAERLEWMIGAWTSEEDGAITTERWCAGEGGSLVGDSVTRAGGAVVHTEVLRVEARGERLVYVASPSGQATTEFVGDARCGSDDAQDGDVRARSASQGAQPATNCSRTCEAVFENPEHDFPNVITYGRCTQNEFLVATITGGGRRASWTFRRAAP